MVPRTIKNSTLPAKLFLKGNLVVKICQDYSKSSSLFFCKSENTHRYLCLYLLLNIFLFRAAPYNHRSAARGAFLRPWEDLRRIWVRFAGGSGTNYECYLSPTRVPQDRLRIFPLLAGYSTFTRHEFRFFCLAYGFG